MKRYLAGAVLAAAVALGASVAQAQSLTGSWQGFAQGIQFNLVVQPNGAYSETQRSGSLMTMQTGVIQSAGAGEIAFVVQDWQPRQMPYTGQLAAKPPGGIWRIQFNGPNSVTMQDVRLGGSVTFTRTQ
jgi:opacity protein-like surface antigen